MAPFLFGIVSSLAASAIALGLGLLRGSRPMWWLIAACSSFNGTGLRRVYRRQASAERDIAHDLDNARWIKVLAGRGNLLTREAFAPVWSGELSPDSVQILLPDPRAQQDSWLDRRSHDVERFDPGYTRSLLRGQVRTNMDYLTHVTSTRGNVELREFNLPNTCRVIATDQAAFLTFYSSSTHGRNSPCLYVRAPGLLYSVALQQFNMAWTHSSPVNPAHP